MSSDYEGPDDWEAESDLQALLRASEIKESQSRMDRVRRFAEKRQQNLKDAVSKVLPPVRQRAFDGAASRTFKRKS